MPIVIKGLDEFRDRLREIQQAIDVFSSQVRQLSKELNQIVQIATTIHKGLDDLKLGNITVDYHLTGRARSQYLKISKLYTFDETIGEKGKDRKRLIATKRFKGKYARGTVKCYAYRGFRTRSDKDHTQGKGIPRVMQKVSSVLR